MRGRNPQAGVITPFRAQKRLGESLPQLPSPRRERPHDLVVPGPDAPSSRLLAGAAFPACMGSAPRRQLDIAHHTNYS